MLNAMTSVRILLATACVVAFASGCSTGSLSPLAAKHLRYTVSYADETVERDVKVDYTDAQGHLVSQVVRTPWTSPELAVRKGQHYRVQATGRADPRSNFVCGVGLNNGWVSSNSNYGGTCSYTFPYDVPS